MYSDVYHFFSQLNFLTLSTNVPGATFLRNEVNGQTLFVILLDNTRGQVWSSSMIQALHQKLASGYTYPDPEPKVLFLLFTNMSGRDRFLADLPGINLWLVDTINQKLLVYENQDTDFFGLRYGIEQTVEASGKSHNPLDIRSAMKDKKRFPYVTLTLIAVNVIWYIVLACMGDTQDPRFMWSMGADFGYSVFVDHEFYRLFLSMFMHFGFAHLAGNMVYLGIAGIHAEKSIGHLRFFLIYILAGLASSVISTAYYFLTDYNTVSAGASGAIYGIIALNIYLIGKNRGKIGKALMFRRIFIIMIFLIYSNFITTGVDVMAHIGGFVAGMLLSIAFLHERKDQKTKAGRT